MKLTKLCPELEAQFPKMLQNVREYYFQLSEEKRKELETETTEKVKDNNYNKITKFCFDCGQKINRIAKFCEICGIKQPDIFENQ